MKIKKIIIPTLLLTSLNAFAYSNPQVEDFMNENLAKMQSVDEVIEHDEYEPKPNMPEYIDNIEVDGTFIVKNPREEGHMGFERPMPPPEMFRDKMVRPPHGFEERQYDLTEKEIEVLILELRHLQKLLDTILGEAPHKGKNHHKGEKGHKSPFNKDGKEHKCPHQKDIKDGEKVLPKPERA